MRFSVGVIVSCRGGASSGGSVHLMAEVRLVVAAVLHVGGALDEVLVHDAHQSVVLVEAQLREERFPNLSRRTDDTLARSLDP